MTQQVHFIGVGGIGMSGLARILCQKSVKVSGSDLRSSDVTRMLEKMGARIFEGHAAGNVAAGSTVVYSTQVKGDNVELQAAKKLGCTLLHRSELLAQLMQENIPLAVAGTHGKTTTTSLLTVVLSYAGWDPSYAVGGIVNQLKTNGSLGNGDYFVFEADESDGSFYRYTPQGAIVTNIDDDHMDHYGTKEALITAFDRFIKSVGDKELLFWCGNDPFLKALKPSGISYGVTPDCQLFVRNIRQGGWFIEYDIRFQGKDYKDIQVALTGQHNVLNSAAVFGLSLRLGVEETAIRGAFKTFEGVGRRCEKKGMKSDVMVIDDYGHHPTEIETTLKALRRAEPSRRLVAVFQPHRYSRTVQCLEGFGRAFDAADVLFITDIYGAMETPIPGVTSQLIVDKVEKGAKLSCHYVGRLELPQKLASFVCPGDLVVTLGAGDITKLGPELLERIKAKG